MCPNSTKLLPTCKFFNDEHADTELFDGLVASCLINKSVAGRWKCRWRATGQLERKHFAVVHAPGARSCLLLVTWWPESLSLTTGVGHPSTAAKQHSPRNMSDTCIHIQIQTYSQTLVSRSKNVSCVNFLGCGFQTSKAEEALE